MSKRNIGKKIGNFFFHLANSFRRIGNHIRASVKLFYRSRLTVFLFLFYPIILLLLFGSIFAKQDLLLFDLGVQDNDATSVSNDLLLKLNTIDVLSIKNLTTDDDPKTIMRQDDLHACLVIPVNWSSDAINPLYSSSNVTLIINSISQSALRVSHLVSNALREFNIEQNGTQPIRFVFIPVIVPVFIPIIFFVPVLLIQYIHIYVPYASPVLSIDVYDEDLAMPTHTIQYLVYDETETPIDDATVIVDYNGTAYPATFIGAGVYEVDLPASDQTETISVTASKSWYPDAILTYDLAVDWIIETVTPPPVTITPPNETITETFTPTALIPIAAIVTSLLCIAVGTILVKRKKM